MRKSHTAAMEIFSAKSCSAGARQVAQFGPVATEPFEAGWAREALAVIYCHEVHGPAPRLELGAQISPTAPCCGWRMRRISFSDIVVRWIDFGHAYPTISAPGGYFLSLDYFGNWLRLAGTVSGGPDDGSAAVLVDIYWVLKE